MTYINPYMYSGMPGFSVPIAAQQSQSYQPSSQQMDGAKWVQGEAGARACSVQPGHMAILMDSEDSVFYMKAVDPYGVPQPLRKFRFTEESFEQKKLSENSTQAPPIDTSKYITKEEFDQKIKEKLEELMR